MDDTLLTHYGQDFEQIAKLCDHVTGTYVWAHDLVTMHYSDDETDYPVLFQLWEPVDLEKLEQGLRAAQDPAQGQQRSLERDRSPEMARLSAGGLAAATEEHPDLQALYDSKLIMVQKLLQAVGGPLIPEMHLPGDL